MEEHKWSRRTVLKYTLMQMPALAAFVLVLGLLHHWRLIPLWTLWILVPLWILKDALLYPFVWKAYIGAGPAMIGSRGKAAEQLDPSGHVRVQGELWLAEVAGGGRAVEKGHMVRVIDIRGLTLVVEPEEKEADIKISKKQEVNNDNPP